jgi:DUF177 domain-containing protein
MLLDLSRIRTPHEHYAKVYEPSAFAPDADYTVVSPVSVEFDIHKDKQTFRLDGRVKATLELPCSRCLEPFRWEVDEPFELTYEPRPAASAEGEREIEDADFSAAFYDNDEIDLEQLVRERFEMSLPMKPLCREDCKGLCPVCGTNWNRGSCTCTTDWEDPRMAALKALHPTEKGH